MTAITVPDSVPYPQSRTPHRVDSGKGQDRVEVQGKCPPKCSARMSLSIPRWSQIAALPELPETAASAGFQHRCISSRCLCECPVPSPSLESTGSQAWPAALPSSAPSAEMSAYGVLRLPATRPRPHHQWHRRDISASQLARTFSPDNDTPVACFLSALDILTLLQ